MIGHMPRGVELLVDGNFNIDSEYIDIKERDVSITAAMAMKLLEDITEHFLLQNFR